MRRGLPRRASPVTKTRRSPQYSSRVDNTQATLPGKLLGGIAGAKPAAPQSAGNTQAPLKNVQGVNDDKSQGETPGIGMQLNGVTIQANNVDQFQYTQQQQYQQSRLQVPPNDPGRG